MAMASLCGLLWLVALASAAARDFALPERATVAPARDFDRFEAALAAQHGQRTKTLLVARPFAVLFVRSSGSTWLAALLNRQPGVLCHDEYVGRASSHGRLDEVFRYPLEKVARALSASGIAPGRSLNRESPEVKAKLRERVACVGFKQKARLAHHSVVRRVVRDSGGRIVVLWRENRVAHALSLLRKEAIIAAFNDQPTKDGSRHISNLGRHGSTKTAFNDTLHVDWDVFESYVDYVDFGRSALRHFEMATPPSNVLRITYEQLYSETEETLTKVLRFINGTAMGMKYPLNGETIFKAAPPNPLDGVANRREFVQRIERDRPDLHADLRALTEPREDISRPRHTEALEDMVVMK